MRNWANKTERWWPTRCSGDDGADEAVLLSLEKGNVTTKALGEEIRDFLTAVVSGAEPGSPGIDDRWAGAMEAVRSENPSVDEDAAETAGFLWYGMSYWANRVMD